MRLKIKIINLADGVAAAEADGTSLHLVEHFLTHRTRQVLGPLRGLRRHLDRWFREIGDSVGENLKYMTRMKIETVGNI